MELDYKDIDEPNKLERELQLEIENELSDLDYILKFGTEVNGDNLTFEFRYAGNENLNSANCIVSKDCFCIEYQNSENRYFYYNNAWEVAKTVVFHLDKYYGWYRS